MSYTWRQDDGRIECVFSSISNFSLSCVKSGLFTDRTCTRSGVINDIMTHFDQSIMLTLVCSRL